MKLSSLIVPYRNLSKEIWSLAFITLVNRTGAMVLPFLSLYLTKHLHLGLDQVAWIMTAYGLGSAAGTYIGGKLTDRFGYYKVMLFSLVTGGLLFIGLQYLTTYVQFLAGIFIVSFIVDLYRPAVWVAMDAYSNEDSKTRSVTLIRLAINLGFSVGPALGGLIIASAGYRGLFWIDGLTCIAAGVMMYVFLHDREMKSLSGDDDITVDTSQKSPYSDRIFLLFVFAILLMGIAFMQFFGTLPLYYDKVIQLTEAQIGLLMAGNGFLIFAIEMPVVHYLEKKKYDAIRIIIWGGWIFVMSFWVLNVGYHYIFPILGMLFLSLGEILSFPFSNTFALKRAASGKKGDYMALYTLTFSLSFVIGPNIGMHIAENYGFTITWYAMGGLMVLGNVLFYILRRQLTSSGGFDTS